jgi:hypothetical protein
VYILADVGINLAQAPCAYVKNGLGYPSKVFLGIRRMNDL